MPDTETVDVPIVVNDSPLLAQLKQAGIYLTLIVTALPALTLLVRNRDIAGTINFVRSEQGIQFGSALIFLGTFIWRQFAKRREVKVGAAIAKTSPIAVLKSEVAADPSLARARETEAVAPAATDVIPLTRLVSLADIARRNLADEVTVHHDNGTPPAAEDHDSNDVTEIRDAIDQMAEYERCDLPPVGWFCTRIKGHKGPCATVRDTTVVLPAAKGEL